MGLKMENIYDDYNLYIFIVKILMLFEYIRCNEKYKRYLIIPKDLNNLRWLLLLVELYLLKYHFKISIIYTLILIGFIINSSKKSIDDVLNEYSRLINK